MPRSSSRSRDGRALRAVHSEFDAGVVPDRDVRGLKETVRAGFEFDQRDSAVFDRERPAARIRRAPRVRGRRRLDPNGLRLRRASGDPRIS